jgi:hypothetical protein
MPKARTIESLKLLDGKNYNNILKFLEYKMVEDRELLRITKDTLSLRDRVEKEEILASVEIFWASLIQGDLGKE